MFLFSWLKFVELFETLFIVFRKQKLLHLHWIHHFLTLILASFLYPLWVVAFQIYGAINATIHFIMYGYYATKAAGFQISRRVALLITTLQVLQMMYFMVMVTFTCYSVSSPKKEYAKIQWLTYFTPIATLVILGLFVNFFYQSYVKKGVTQKSKKA